MPTAPPTFRPVGAPARREVNRAADARRGSARERGYTSAWDRAAAGHLRAHPLCWYCELGAFGPARVTAATLVDHFHPHRGDQAVFWWRKGWISSCADCHNGPKQTLERQGDAALDALARRLGLPPRSAAGGVGGSKV